MYTRAHHRIRPMILAITAAALPAIFACGGGGEKKAAADVPPPCTTPADSILGGALEKFITTREPSPVRFLIAMGTDSVVPDGAQYVLNEIGRAMYVWPSDPAAAKSQVDNMRAKGAYVTLVLFYHGTADQPDGSKAFDFSGMYIDKPNDGKRIAHTRVIFNCAAPEGSKYNIGAGAAPAGDSQTPATPGKSGGGED